MDFLVEEENIDKRQRHTLWTEKYRPISLEEYVGNDVVKQTISAYIDKKDIPQLLFFGPAGTGKTTLAKIIIKNIPCDMMYINASDENGIDTIRDKIKNFACSAGFRPLKIIILDEADFLTPNAQAALRSTFEVYSVHTRFILTCNYKEKIINPILSRCQAFEIRPLSKKEVAINLVKILQTENVKFTQDDVVFIVNSYYPDVRKIINFASQSNVNGEIKISKENAIESDLLESLINLLKDYRKPSLFNEIRQLIADSDPDSFELLYKGLFNRVQEYSKDKEALIILEIAESVYQSTLVIPAVRDITFLACIYKILKHLKA